MADSERQNDSSGISETDEWIDADQFRDLPTSTEHGTFISYFDTMLWVADHLIVGGWMQSTQRPNWDEWDEADRRIRDHCETGELVAYGQKPKSDGFDEILSEIPSLAWPQLQIDVTRGQPEEGDRDRHGGREYGEARWPHTGDVAWTAVRFRKSDVLKHWPETDKLRTYLVDHGARQRELGADDKATTQLGLRSKRGPKPRYDWPLAREHAFSLLEKYGDFDPSDLDWCAQADLERDVQNFMERPPTGVGNGPSESTVRKYVSCWVNEWRDIKAKADN